MLRQEISNVPPRIIHMFWVALLAIAVTLPIDASTLSIVDPVNEWIDTLTGPIAFALGVLVLVGLGIAFGFGKVDFQQLAISGSVTVLLLGLVFLARPLIRELFGTSSTPAAALLGF